VGELVLHWVMYLHQSKGDDMEEELPPTSVHSFGVQELGA
jgi:hypothetical protein